MESRPVVITRIGNPLKPLESRTIETILPGATVHDCIERFYPLAPPEMDVAISLNGLVLAPGEYDRRGLVLNAGDSLAFCVVPKGGGGDGKNPLAAIAMLAVVVVAAWAGPAAAGLYTSLGSAVGATSSALVGGLISAGVSTAIMTIGGLLVNALFPSSLPSLDGFSGGPGESPTYSWTPQPNAVAEGVVRPVPYGVHRVAPPLIGKYIETIGNQQYLNLLYLVADCKVASIGDIQINGTAMDYYAGVTAETRLGQPDQPVIQCFGDTRADIGVQAPLTTGWVVRETTGNGVQGLGIGFSCPGGLGYANDEGGIGELTLKIHAEYRLMGTAEWKRLKTWNTVTVTVPGDSGRWSGGYENIARQWIEIEDGGTSPGDHVDGERYYPQDPPAVFDLPYGGRPVYRWRWIADQVIYRPGELAYDYITISGATRNAVHQVFYRDNLPEAGTYEMRVRLAEAPPSGLRYMTSIYWEYYQEIVYDDFCLPGSALLAVRALATDQLSGGLPRLTCLVDRGTVPVWTGSAYADKPSSNPAWASYDMLHDDYYGAGLPPDRFDLEAFDYWAGVCDAEGYEINIYFDSDMTIRSALDIAGILGRGAAVQIGVRWTAIVDCPETLPVQHFLFTMGNMVRDSFSLDYLPMDDRADLVEVSYFDRELNHTRQTVTIEGDHYAGKAGAVNKTSVSLLGETRRSYAARYGRFLLNQARYVTLTASWTAGIDSLACLPGDVVDVSHDVPQWGYSGRVVSADADTVVLDRPVPLFPGVRYGVSVNLGDSDQRSEAGITAPAAHTETATLALSGEWSSGLPDPDGLYLFGEVGRASKRFRIIRISRASDQKRKITAVEYVPEIYADKRNLPDPVNVSDLRAVSGLAVRELWLTGPDGSGRSALNLTWRGFAVSWGVYIRETGGAWEYAGTAYTPEFRIDRPLNLGGTYEVSVTRGQGPDAGAKSAVTIRGKLAPPSDVTGFRAWASGGRVMFSWNHIPDGDRWGYEIRQGAAWETGRTIVDLEQSNRTEWAPPLSGSYRFLIKAVDRSGIRSVNAASAVVTVTVTEPLNIVLTADEIPDGAAAGSCDRMVYLAGAGICWIPGLTDADVSGHTDQSPELSAYAGDWESGAYTTRVYDLGAVAAFSLRMDADIEAAAGTVTDRTYPARTDRSYPGDTDRSITSLSTYKREYRVSDDGAVWSDWAEWSAPVDLSGRYYQGRFSPVLDARGGTFAFTDATAVLDVPDQVKTVKGQAVAAGGSTFTLAGLGLNILQEYHVGVTVLGSGAAYPVVDRQASQFTVRLFDSGGSAVSGTVDIEIRGF